MKMNDYDYEKMEQLIATNGSIRLYLKLCYLEEIYEDKFMEELTDYCYQNKVSEDRALAHFFAIWLPGDKDYENIMKKINEIAAKR